MPNLPEQSLISIILKMNERLFKKGIDLQKHYDVINKVYKEKVLDSLEGDPELTDNQQNFYADLVVSEIVREVAKQKLQELNEKLRNVKSPTEKANKLVEGSEETEKVEKLIEEGETLLGSREEAVREAQENLGVVTPPTPASEEPDLPPPTPETPEPPRRRKINGPAYDPEYAKEQAAWTKKFLRKRGFGGGGNKPPRTPPVAAGGEEEEPEDSGYDYELTESDVVRQAKKKTRLAQGRLTQLSVPSGKPTQLAASGEPRDVLLPEDEGPQLAQEYTLSEGDVIKKGKKKDKKEEIEEEKDESRQKRVYDKKRIDEEGKHRIGEVKELLGEVGGSIQGYGRERGGPEGDAIGEGIEIAELAARASAGDPVAIGKLAAKAAKRFDAMIEQQKMGAKSALQGLLVEQSAEGIMGKGFESAQHYMDSFGIQSRPFRKIVEFGQVVADSVHKLREWNENLFQTNIKFSEFSAGMAHVRAEQEVRDIFLSQRRGDRLSESAQMQAEQKHRLNENLSTVEDAFTKFRNIMSAGASSMASDFLEKTINNDKTAIGKLLKEWLDEGEQGAQKDYANRWMFDVGEEWSKNRGRPNRFAPE